MGEIISKSQNSLNIQNWAQHGTVFLKLKNKRSHLGLKVNLRFHNYLYSLAALKGNGIELGCIETTVVGSVLLGIKIYCRAR